MLLLAPTGSSHPGILKKIKVKISPVTTSPATSNAAPVPLDPSVVQGPGVQNNPQSISRALGVPGPAPAYIDLE